MTQSKKTATVSDLRKILYEQVDLIKAGKSDYKIANAVSKATNQIFMSYKLQIAATKLARKKFTVNSLKGLLDS